MKLAPEHQYGVRRFASGEVRAYIDGGYAQDGCGHAIAVFARVSDVDVQLLHVSVCRPGTDPYACFGRVEQVYCPVLIVAEKPQLDGRSDTAAASNLELSWQTALFVGQMGAYFGADVWGVTPREWKGGARKPHMHSTLWEDVLSERERRLVQASWDRIRRALVPKGAPEGDIGERIEAACRFGARANWAQSGGHYYGTWKGHNILDAVAMGAVDCGRYR